MANGSPRSSNDADSHWAQAIRQRRKALLQRVGMGAASALVFSPVIGWDIGMIWVLGYLVVQAVDLIVFGPVNAGKTDRITGVRRVAGWIMLMGNAGYFGTLSLMLWWIGGAMGGVCAALVLSAGAIYSMINAPRSRTVLILTVTPQFAYLALTPVFMAIGGASPGFVTAAAVGVGVFMAYCLSTWSRMNQAREAEAAARLEAEAQTRQAMRTMQGRSDFLAAVGHDLRTPISAILTGAAELESGATDPSALTQAQLITDAGLMMKAMLDDLLDHAKLEAGHMKVEVADFDLRELMGQTVRLWQAPARAKGLTLRMEGAAGLPAGVRGDALRIRQVLNNLISNAMKFTREGSVTLRLHSWRDEMNAHALLIQVEDTGPGMTRDQLARLFTPFDQTEDGVSAAHGGTGLGLAISLQLAQLMGGRLTARSAPGEGATFTLSLTLPEGEAARDAAAPSRALDQESRDVVARALSVRAQRPEAPAVEAAPLPPPAPLPIEAAEPPTAPMEQPVVVEAEPVAAAVEDEGADDDRPLRVLVVDDHDINRRAIQLILQPLGCDISTAENGMAALGVCADNAFDLIFMDVRMPELDGRETTRRIRAGGGPNAAVPIIAVTADTSPEDIAQCTDAGMTYFVPKPITPPMLLGAINHVLCAPAEEAGEDEAQTVAA